MGKGKIKLGDHTFDLASNSLRDSEGLVIALRKQSVRVLTTLAEANGQLVERDHLIETIWSGIAVTDDSLVQCIRDIRLALKDNDRQIVRTVVGRGYSLHFEYTNATLDKMPGLIVEPFSIAGTSTMADDVRDELHETLISRLVARAGVRVLTEPDLRKEANYIISGKLRVRDDTVRIFFQISQADGQAVLFSDAREAVGHQVFDLPEDVSDSIAAQLRVLMIVNDGEESRLRSNSELTVQELKAKAAWHMARFKRDNWMTAKAALARACEISPDDPVALAMYASMSTQLLPMIPFDEVKAETDGAFERANRAVELGQSVDYVLRTRGNIRFWLLHDHDGARRDCERALSHNAAFHLAHLTIAESEIFSGEYDAGIGRLRDMMQRAPLDPQNPLYYSLIAIGEVLAGRGQKAYAASRECVELWPTQAWTALVHAVACVAAGKSNEAPSSARYQDLPRDHFRAMPFGEEKDVIALEDLLETAIRMSP